jgi:hypothetical protein
MRPSRWPVRLAVAFRKAASQIERNPASPGYTTVVKADEALLFWLASLFSEGGYLFRGRAYQMTWSFAGCAGVGYTVVEVLLLRHSLSYEVL